jgi:hypothetical protein
LDLVWRFFKGLAQGLGAPQALQGKVQRVVHGPGVGRQVALEVEARATNDDDNVGALLVDLEAGGGDVDGGDYGSMVRTPFKITEIR